MMGVRILVGHEQGDHGYESEVACLFDSVTGWAFGPIFHRGEHGDSPEDLAEGFLRWLEQMTGGRDARTILALELEELYDRWAKRSEVP